MHDGIEHGVLWLAVIILLVAGILIWAAWRESR